MSDHNATPKIKVTKDGPYLISGNIPMSKYTILIDEKGVSTGWAEGPHYSDKEECALCRCGHSDNMPYCDGTHGKIKFDGTESAGNEPFEKQARRIEGPDFELLDVKAFCSFARFCDLEGGVWELTRDDENPDAREIVIKGACNCPSGRLVFRDKATGEVVEPVFEPSIGIIEDPGQNVGGPIWVRGGIPVESADGIRYEVRNRVNLCRCGASANKPFCDGKHAKIGFQK